MILYTIIVACIQLYTINNTFIWEKYSVNYYEMSLKDLTGQI